MDKIEALRMLEQELKPFREYSYADLACRMSEESLRCNRTGASGVQYQVEIQRHPAQGSGRGSLTVGHEASSGRNGVSKVFVNIGLSLDGYVAPEGMTLEHWDNPGYKDWAAKWGALMGWIFQSFDIPSLRFDTLVAITRRAILGVEKLTSLSARVVRLARAHPEQGRSTGTRLRHRAALDNPGAAFQFPDRPRV